MALMPCSECGRRPLQHPSAGGR